MKKNTIILLFLSIGLFSLCGKPAKFAKGIVDVGIVAEDLERTVKFYTEAVGLKEIKGFEASAEKATQFGLTDNQPARVRVFVLGDAPGSARLKIMAFPKRPGTKPDQKFIHSTIGISYLTLRVSDMDDALARLKKAKVKTLGATPASLGGKMRITVFHDPDGNFVELIGPVKE
ncbi:MAG: VOC family protein [Opitutae bacterium]|jgi:lactoylglutathione lyase|nr:VOC family protein [Opitutae bacterium]MBT5908638.1 VOC family protein [Opitutae bacterium]MBT6849729.1 VOC family protein [Opitutae bacterium]